MIRPLVHRLRRYAGLRTGLRSRVRKAVDAGVGIYNRTWPLDETTTSPYEEAAAAPTPAGNPSRPLWADSPRTKAETLSPQVVDWCRFAMGQMGKPYGLDYVSLVMAIMSADDREVDRVNFGVLRPQEFYSEDGVARRVEEELLQWEETGLLSSEGGAGPLRLVVLLFSWGDLTRELLPAG